MLTKLLLRPRRKKELETLRAQIRRDSGIRPEQKRLQRPFSYFNSIPRLIVGRIVNQLAEDWELPPTEPMLWALH